MRSSPAGERIMRQRRSANVAARVAEPLSVEVTCGQLAPAVMAGRITPSAKMPAEMSTIMAEVTEMAVMAKVTKAAAAEAPEMSKAAQATKAVEAMKASAKPMKAPAKTVKATAAETVKTAAAPKGRGFAHYPRRDAWREGSFEHKPESDRHCDDFHPFTSHHALLLRPPFAEPSIAGNRAEAPWRAILSPPRQLLGEEADVVNTDSEQF